MRLFPGANAPSSVQIRVPVSRRVGAAAWLIFAALLVVLPILRQASSSQALAVFDSFFRVGSLVFGGGHVVLPLLQAEVVGPGWVANESFVAGYGAALRGINAAVVGLLLAALYRPVWTSAIHATADFGLGLLAFGLLAFWKWPPWLVVVLTALGGEIIARL